MTRWCVWRRISPCAICSSTVTATSALSMATPRPPTDTPRRACRRSPTKCCAISTRTPLTGTRTLTRPAASRACCRAASRTCSSTAARASPSAWRRISRRTTSPRSSTPACACSKIRMPRSAISCSTSRARTSRPGASSSAAAASARPTPPAAAASSCAPAPRPRRGATTASASS